MEKKNLQTYTGKGQLIRKSWECLGVILTLIIFAIVKITFIVNISSTQLTVVRIRYIPTKPKKDHQLSNTLSESEEK